jgi:alkanesulfonate monooxygenase SsuD/methylene tetrahydromethanopterin reductase-like flavin-dependent oxidoreductase (luciferase family)
MTDEILDVVMRLLAGEAVTHAGPAVTVRGVTLAPLPVQQPRIPVWVGGGSPGARRRAARWDGWIPVPFDDDGRLVMTPADLRAGVEGIAAARAGGGIAPDQPYVVGIHGETPTPGRDGATIVRPWADAGANWWLELLHGYRGSTEDLVARVEAGPPRI